MKFIKSNLEPITIELYGEKYPARLTFRALAELEELTHISFMTLFDNFSEGTFSTNDIIHILFVALKYGGVEITLDDLKDMDFTADFLKSAMNEIGNLLQRTQKVVSQIQDHNKPEDDKKK